MASAVQKLTKLGLINPPNFVVDNIAYETIMGSFAYGISSDSSDMDVYGFCIPTKTILFPHLLGVIPGFGTQPERFEQYQQHHIKSKDDLGGDGREYDITIYNIVKYFNLVMECNPNMLDSLFTPQNCVLHCTQVANMVRENRKMFIHKGLFHKYKGYAFGQAHKMGSKDPKGKRKVLRETYGFDTKYAANLVRILSECEQLLIEGDLDLQEKGRREHCKAIRRGEVTEKDVLAWMSDKERHLEDLYAKCTLPWGPDEPKIKQLLLDCLEHHYGSLGDAIVNPDKYHVAFLEMQKLVEKYQ